MSDLICAKTMRRCETQGMCAPYGGCRPQPATESVFKEDYDRLRLELTAERARGAELEQALKFARTTLAVIATSQHLSAVERRSAQSEVNRIDALICAAPPNIAPSSEHKVPIGITHISRSLGRAIVRFDTSEQLNDFYRAAKTSLTSPQ